MEITRSDEAYKGSVNERRKHRDCKDGQCLKGLPPVEIPSSGTPERINKQQHLGKEKRGERVMEPELKLLPVSCILYPV